MAIQSIPTPPTIDDVADFASRTDAFVAALAQLVSDLNTIANAGITVTSPSSGVTASIASGVATTIAASSLRAVEIVYAYLNNGGASNYTAFAILISDRAAGVRIAAQVNGSLLTITLSGNNIQVTQSSGGSTPINWKILSF